MITVCSGVKDPETMKVIRCGILIADDGRVEAKPWEVSDGCCEECFKLFIKLNGLEER